MKKMIFASLLLSVLFSFRTQACEGELQIISKIKSVNFNSAGDCIVIVTDVEVPSSNMFCPLSIDDVLATGITLKGETLQSCIALVGQPLSGVVVKKGDVLNIE